METKKRSTPTLFWVIAVAALLWNFMGVCAYLFDMFFITSEKIAQMESGMQELYMNRSMLQNIVYGLGVGGGFLGSVFLLLRKPSAIIFFLISLVGVILQFVYGLAMTNTIEVLGPSSLILPAVVILIAAFLFWYSRHCKVQKFI